MRSQARSTNCPFCSTPLGVTVEGCWVAMSLDEYREYALTRLNPNLAGQFSSDTCIGCHSAITSSKPAHPSAAATLTDGESAVGISVERPLCVGSRRMPLSSFRD